MKSLFLMCFLFLSITFSTSFAQFPSQLPYPFESSILQMNGVEVVCVHELTQPDWAGEIQPQLLIGQSSTKSKRYTSQFVFNTKGQIYLSCRSAKGLSYDSTRSNYPGGHHYEYDKEGKLSKEWYQTISGYHNYKSHCEYKYGKEGQLTQSSGNSHPGVAMSPFTRSSEHSRKFYSYNKAGQLEKIHCAFLNTPDKKFISSFCEWDGLIRERHFALEEEANQLEICEWDSTRNLISLKYGIWNKAENTKIIEQEYSWEYDNTGKLLKLHRQYIDDPVYNYTEVYHYHENGLLKRVDRDYYNKSSQKKRYYLFTYNYQHPMFPDDYRKGLSFGELFD